LRNFTANRTKIKRFWPGMISTISNIGEIGLGGGFKEERPYFGLTTSIFFNLLKGAALT